ncbi:MAG TPA: lysophospholipid acyltransferase family protein [Methylomirabilota bacterium]|nr:lysophospholipid acyltransferase family protein [Methylomirabilota bacterium]
MSVHGGPGYRLVRGFARLVLGLFYRRLEVVGAERVPAGGALILAANHQNALVDPMLLLAAVERRLVPLAKAPLFRHPLIGPFLRLVGAIAVHRREDPGSDPALNQAMFRSVIAWLQAGGALLIFPEGGSRPEPALRPLRSGAARMLLAAEAASGGALGVRLVPAGLVFHEPGGFRTGRALVIIGEPLPTADCIALYATDPAAAVRRLTDRLAERLRAVMVEADDRQTLQLLELLGTMWRQEFADVARDPGARAQWMQRAMRAYRYLQRAQPRRAAGFRRSVEHYAKALDLAGVGAQQLSRSYARGVVWRYALREGLSLLLGLPLALLGMVLHLAPYLSTAGAVRALRPDPDEQATYGIAAATVLYPACWALGGWVAWQLGGGAWLTAYILALAPAGFFALGWRARLERLRREARTFLHFLLHRDLHRRLAARRRALVNEMTTLARAVPESVLDGDSPRAKN